jgi:hypothetical protein
MAKQFRTEFQVEGGGSFPLDMLRYDSCWPKTQQDVAIMDAFPGTSGKRTVTLVSASLRVSYVPTADRWASFSWSVVPGSVKTYKVE